MNAYCIRCGNPLTVSLVSRFNTDEICLDCEAKERQHPDYDRAVTAERTAIEDGNCNFRGIGLPDDL